MEKVYDNYWCMRDKGCQSLREYIRLVKNFHHECETVVRCAAGTSESFAAVCDQCIP